MRFSIRYVLAVMSYVALLAATVGTQNRNLVDLVWVVALFAFCYAIVVACIDRGKRQAMAIGFVALSAVHVACLYATPVSAPAVRILQTAGYTVDTSTGLIYESLDPQLSITSGQRARYNPSYQRAKGYLPQLRAANGVVTFAAGLVGSLIGLLAYQKKSAA